MIRFLFIIILPVLVSCTPKERPITYGTDECSYCKMIIMDQRYGAELVTDKGKVYVFDAAECLVDFMHYHGDIGVDASMLLVTPYTDPDKLYDAKQASYLVSGKMPSPMGAYLSSFKDLATAQKFQATNGGEIYTWEELYKDLKSIRLDAIRQYE
jgi:copper chaperone NosL